MVLVARTEEPCDRTEHASALVSPCDPAAALERRQDLFEIGMDRRHASKSTHHIDRTVVIREDHRLFRRQRELLGCRFIREVIRRGMVRCPFPKYRSFTHAALASSLTVMGPF